MVDVLRPISEVDSENISMQKVDATGDVVSESSKRSYASDRDSCKFRASASTASNGPYGDVEGITSARIREISLELGIVRLSWPEVPSADERKLYPSSYIENNSKEKLLLWYTENFRRQFHHNFPHRRPLLLAVENECGVQEIMRNVTGKPNWAQQK